MRKIYWYLTSFVRKYGIILVVTIVGGAILFSVILPTLLQTNLKNGLPATWVWLDSLPLDRLLDFITKQLSVGFNNCKSR